MTPFTNFIVRATRGMSRRTRSLAIRQTLRQRGLRSAWRIPTFTVEIELEALFQLASECPPSAKVLEIGSYLGASTCFIAAGLKGRSSRITCVDTWQNQTMPEGIRDTLVEFESNLAPVRSQLTLVRSTTAAVSTAELDGPFDLIFFDGDHSYLQTQSDFLKFGPLLTANGIIAFHDSLFFEGVSRVVGEALASANWQIGGCVRNLFWVKRASFTEKS